MAVSVLLGLIDDIGALGARVLGRPRSSNMSSYSDPQTLINELRNPITEERAVARMRKMHYGAFYGKKTRGRFSGLAENELLTKGKGFGGAIFGRPMKGLSVGITHLKGAIMFAPAQGILESYRAKRGHKMSALIGGTAKAVAYGLGDLIGTAIGGPVAGLALGIATEKMGGLVEEGMQFLHDFNRNLKHVNMGGNYEDSRVAYTMRQRAAQEMGSSVMNARMYLGREARLMHQ